MSLLLEIQQQVFASSGNSQRKSEHQMDFTCTHGCCLNTRLLIVLPCPASYSKAFLVGNNYLALPFEADTTVGCVGAWSSVFHATKTCSVSPSCGAFKNTLGPTWKKNTYVKTARVLIRSFGINRLVLLIISQKLSYNKFRQHLFNVLARCR